MSTRDINIPIVTANHFTIQYKILPSGLDVDITMKKNEIIIRLKVPARKKFGLINDQVVPRKILQNLDAIKETTKDNINIPKRVNTELAINAAISKPIKVDIIFAIVIEIKPRKNPIFAKWANKILLKHTTSINAIIPCKKNNKVGLGPP